MYTEDRFNLQDATEQTGSREHNGFGSVLTGKDDSAALRSMTSADSAIPEQFRNTLTLVSADANKSGDTVFVSTTSDAPAPGPKLPDGAIGVGTAGAYWQQGKYGWQQYASEGFEKHNRFFEKVKGATKDDAGNVTLEMESKGKVIYNKDGQITTTQFPDGSKNDFGWTEGKLSSMALTADGKTKTYTLGSDGQWQDEKGTKLKYASFSIGENAVLDSSIGDKYSRQFTDGSKRNSTIERKTDTDGVRTSETATSSDGKIKIVRDYDSTGNGITRERALIEGVLTRDLTFKDGKRVKEIGYDEKGKKECQEDFDKDGKATRFLTYDRTGNVLSKSEFNGNVTTRTSYDAVGHKTEELVTTGASLTALRKFNKDQQVVEERSWDFKGTSLGKKTFEYENDQKVKEKCFAPPAEILTSETSFKDGKKAVETFYQTEAPYSLLGNKKLEIAYTPGGAKSCETKYHLGGVKDVEFDYDTTDPTGVKKLRERRYGEANTVREELEYGPDGKTYLPPKSTGGPVIPVPEK